MLSVAFPVYNEEASLEELYQRTTAVLEGITDDYELVFVDDGSRDRSGDIIESLHRNDLRVRLIAFSRNFGKEIAMLAAYDHARGRAVIVMDADLQTPPEVIPKLVERWRAGADIVDTVRTSTEAKGRLRALASWGFYWVMSKLGNVEITANAVDFRLLDGKVVDCMRRCRERFRFNRGLVAWMGFRREFVEFEAPGRLAGTSRWPLRTLFAYALDAIISFSSVPLRVAGFCGLLLSGLSFLYLLVLGYIRVFHGQPMPGYATLAGGIFLLGGVQLITIWFLGEYVGRIYEEIKGRPPYVVARRLGWPAEASGGAAEQPTT